MKRLTGFLFLCSLTVLLIVTGSVSALPTTWTDVIDWNPDEYIGSDESFSYFHDITDGTGDVEGFDGILMGGDDVVSTYSLTLGIYDDSDSFFDYWEVAYINQPGIIGDTFIWNFDYVETTLSWSIAGIISLNIDGTLGVTITSLLGDFNLDYSKLVATGDNGTAPVPEPATMLLLGMGLIGLAVAGKKKLVK